MAQAVGQAAVPRLAVARAPEAAPVELAAVEAAPAAAAGWDDGRDPAAVVGRVPPAAIARAELA